MQYDHIYAAICILIKLKVMFGKLYTRIYFNVGTFNFSVNTRHPPYVRPTLVQHLVDWLFLLGWYIYTGIYAIFVGFF